MLTCGPFMVLILALIANCGLGDAKFAKSSAGDTPVNVVHCPSSDCLVPDIVVGASGTFHMVYGTSDKQAFYQQGVDNGKSWTPRVHLNRYSLNVTTTMGERGPKVSLGDDGTLHVVWFDLWFPGASTYGRYTRSLDNGQTWSAPVQATGVPGIDGLTVVAAGHAVTVLYHVTDSQPTNASSATWMYQVVSTDGGATLGLPGSRVPITGLQGVACSMCQVSARARPATAGLGGADGQYIAYRSAVESIRDFYLLQGPSGPSGAYLPLRVPISPPWYVEVCPMNGPTLTLDPSGKVLLAFMTGDANHVYWAMHDPARQDVNFTGPFPTPAQTSSERYGTAVANGAGDVLLVWQVGPMATSGTATVYYAMYGLDGSVRGPAVTLGTSFAGTKATAVVGSDDQFYIITTAVR